MMWYDRGKKMSLSAVHERVCLCLITSGQSQKSWEGIVEQGYSTSVERLYLEQSLGTFLEIAVLLCRVLQEFLRSFVQQAPTLEMFLANKYLAKLQKNYA